MDWSHVQDFQLHFTRMHFSLIFSFFFLCFQEFFHVSFSFFKNFLQKHFQNQRRLDSLELSESSGMMVGMVMMTYAFSLSFSLGVSSLQLNICTSQNGFLAASVFWFFFFTQLFDHISAHCIINSDRFVQEVSFLNMIYGKHCSCTNLQYKNADLSLRWMLKC